MSDASPTTLETPLRVLIVDDHAGVRAAMRLALSRQRHFTVEIVGEAVDGVDALSAVAQRRPDVVAMDVDMP